MRSRWTVMWGGTLLLIGVLLLAQQAGLFGPLRLSLMVLLLGFPALMFLLTFALDRRQWWALIPGFALLSLTAVAFNRLSPYAVSVVSGAIFLLTIGVAFWLIFIVKRRLWWALLISAVVTVLAVVAIVGYSRSPGRVIGAILYALLGSIHLSFAVLLFGLPALMFLLVFILDRRQWWALIPSCALMGLTAVLLNELNQFSSSLISVAIFLFSIGLSFWLIYFIKRWWAALIPAGVLTVFTSMLILADNAVAASIIGAIFFFGLALVFLLIRLVNHANPAFNWPWWPAGILAAIGVLILLLDSAAITPYLWPLLLIVVGGGLLLRNFLQPRSVQ